MSNIEVAATQQFYLTIYIAVYCAVATLFVQMIVTFLTWRQSLKTHHLVNSQWTEWKTQFMAESRGHAARQRAEGVREGRDQEEVQRRDHDERR